MTNEFVGIAARRNQRRFILSLLILMILVNMAVRYPLDRVTPMGSDSYFTLDLGRSLAEEGRARWVITPLSYFGFYPLSYPSGMPFEYAELHLLGGLDWNVIALTCSLAFTVLFILAGFLLFRAFRLRDDLAVVLSGLMALSPVFLYFTFEQASGRGFLVPIFMMGLFIIVLPLRRSWSTVILFSMLTFGAFAIHRSSLLIVLVEGMAGLALALKPIVTRKSRTIRRAAYAGCVAFGLSMIVWPYVPGLREVFGSITAIFTSFRTAEWEFRTGFFFSGDSLFVLLMNLATNYIGGLGIILLLLPIGFMALYPTSRDSRERDVFLIACFLVFAPFVWKAQYIQLVILPLVYLLAGLAIQRRDRVKDVMLAPIRRFRRRPRAQTRRVEYGRLRAALLSSFFVACLMFSMFMFNHRSNITEPTTGERNWPNESEVNLGYYLRVYDTNNKQFISASGILDRRIRWFSDWDSPITDAASLQASGYLNANKSTFVFRASEKGDYIEFFTSFYEVSNNFVVSDTAANLTLYDLSCRDIYGFFRLYYDDENLTWLKPHVSTDYARITMMIEINTLGDSISNIYLGEGALHSMFLTEISTNTYIVYANEAYSSFLVAHLVPGG